MVREVKRPGDDESTRVGVTHSQPNQADAHIADNFILRAVGLADIPLHLSFPIRVAAGNCWLVLSC